MPEPLIGYLPRRAALEHHLQHNHYPPVSAAFVDPAEQAIEAVIAACQAWDPETGDIEMIDLFVLDQNVTVVDGVPGMTIRHLMDGLHLWPFVSHALLQADGLQADAELKAGEL